MARDAVAANSAMCETRQRDAKDQPGITPGAMERWSRRVPCSRLAFGAMCMCDASMLWRLLRAHDSDDICGRGRMLSGGQMPLFGQPQPRVGPIIVKAGWLRCIGTSECVPRKQPCSRPLNSGASLACCCQRQSLPSHFSLDGKLASGPL
mmetsp:Transcript_71786/g.159663  ORF Transcript_71786/g.159663 Transcript_71786/m.159663 type:complete len:150 (+) Transcript_71786:510-959(+)